MAESIASTSRRRFLAGSAALAATTFLTPPVLRAQGPTPTPAAPDDPWYRAASDFVADLAAKKVSSVELVERCIKRIEGLDPHINAVVVRDFDRARKAAAEADSALARGERKPLLGLPMTVKESFNVAGLPTTWGIQPFKDFVPDEDAVTVARLKAAGAIILGKTNVPVALADWQTNNPIYGQTKNPYDIERTPGGSSGGAAAALSAGYVSLELGSDIGGSLRTPAHFCGVFSHKPTLDLIPERGQSFPRTRPLPGSNGLSVVGPMARTARDLVLEFDVLAGPDELTAGVGYKLDLPAPRHAALKDFRVLVIDTHPLGATSEDIRGALDRLAQKLEQAGARVARSSPLLPDLAAVTRNFLKLLAPVLSQGRPAEYYERMAKIAEQFPADDQSLDAIYLRSLNPSWHAWLAAARQRSVEQARWRTLFREFDVVLCPVMPTVAFKHQSAGGTAKIEVDGTPQPYISNIMWAAAATSAGLPASVAPIDRSPTALPIGVQIIGPFLEDRTTIAFAGLIEREFGGFIPPVF